MERQLFPCQGDVNISGQSLPLEGIRSMPRHPDEVERKKFPSTEKHSEADYLISLGFAQPASPTRGSPACRKRIYNLLRYFLHKPLCGLFVIGLSCRGRKEKRQDKGFPLWGKLSLSRNPNQAERQRFGFLSYPKDKNQIINERRVWLPSPSTGWFRFHFQVASFFKFMAANFSFTHRLT